MWQANKILPSIVLSYTSGDNCCLCCWCHEYNGVMVAIRYSVTDADAVIISCLNSKKGEPVRKLIVVLLLVLAACVTIN